MKTRHNFTKLNSNELTPWLQSLNVDRTISTIKLFHHRLSFFQKFRGRSHFSLQRLIHAEHIERMGLDYIAPHFIIYPDGSILTGRQLHYMVPVAHQHNKEAVCISYLINHDTQTVTSQQQEAMTALLAALVTQFKLPPTAQRIQFHNWFQSSNARFRRPCITTRSDEEQNTYTSPTNFKRSLLLNVLTNAYTLQTANCST